MREFHHQRPAVIGPVAVLFLGSCVLNSGGNTQQGAFIDGPVEGLRYETATHSGYTDSNGTFNFESGETVAFFVGDILVGEAIGADTLSSFDLAGIAPPQADVDVAKAVSEATHRLKPTALDRVINTSVFLQTLDEDGDPSNGIRIPESLHALATNTEIDVNTKTYVFRRRFGLSPFLATARTSGVWSEPRRMRDAADALDSLYANLEIVPEIYRKKTVEETGNSSFSSGRTVYTYDSNDELMEARFEPNGNGTSLPSSRSTIRVIGADAITESRYSGNGVLDSKIIQFRDMNGMTFRTESSFVHHGANGDKTTTITSVVENPTFSEARFYVLSGSNNETKQPTDTTHFNPDMTHAKLSLYDGASSVVNDLTTYEYDNLGNIVTANLIGDPTTTRALQVSEGNPSVSPRVETAIRVGGVLVQKFVDEFDADGRLSHQYEYTPADALLDKSNYEYDSRGNLALSETDQDGNDTVDWKTSRVYTYEPTRKWRTQIRQIEFYTPLPPQYGAPPAPPPSPAPGGGGMGGGGGGGGMGGGA